MTSPFASVTSIVTRRSEQSAALMERISSLGGTVVSMPLIEVHLREDDLVRSVVDRMSDYDALVFTSANAVRALVGACRHAGVDVLSAAPVCYAVGAATARQAEQVGLHCRTAPQVRTSKELAAWLLTLDAFCQPAQVLFLHGQLSEALPAQVLRSAGHTVDAVVCYDTAPVVYPQERWQAVFAAGGRFVIFVYSPSAASSLTRQCASWLTASGDNIALAAIGPTTAAALHGAGFPPRWIANKPSDEALLAVVAEDLSRGKWPLAHSLDALKHPQVMRGDE